MLVRTLLKKKYRLSKRRNLCCYGRSTIFYIKESNLYRSWKADVIGMTNMPEAKLAREAGN